MIKLNDIYRFLDLDKGLASEYGTLRNKLKDFPYVSKGKSRAEIFKNNCISVRAVTC